MSEAVVSCREKLPHFPADVLDGTGPEITKVLAAVMATTSTARQRIGLPGPATGASW
ncbi:hypothetical protein ABT154_33750 [Streptomyces sp. NPDC001728]|uniref:hypothetical protein n=1 Tax=Streptomyces sp. NPDC001728 TaxID=3154396 RepID=UPI00332BB150